MLLKKSGVNRKLGPSERETSLIFILKLSPLQNHFATQFCQCDPEMEGEGDFVWVKIGVFLPEAFQSDTHPFTCQKLQTG